MIRILLLIFVSFSAVCPAEENQVPFAEYANAFAEAAGHGDLKRETASLEPVLYDSYTVVQLGLFEVWHPRRSLIKDARLAKRFQTAALALLDLQGGWLDWVADGEVQKAALADLKTLRKWTKSWKTSRIAKKKKAEEGRPDLLKLLKAKEEVQAASERFAACMKQAEYMNREADSEQSIFILLAPDRRNFLEAASFIGSLSAYNKSCLWKDSLATWTTFKCNEIKGISLEYPTTVPGKGDITLGSDMNEYYETGLGQHVMMFAAQYLLNHYHQGNFPRDLIHGLAMNLVVDFYEEIHIRSGTGSMGSKTGPISRFVAGGSSSGGRLAGRKLKPQERRWHKDHGKDYFLQVLRQAQKEGAKVAAKEKPEGWNKRAFFLLETDAGVKKYNARAPFLGNTQAGQAVPADYKNDFTEFYISYHCAFVYWLRNKAKIPESEESTGELLDRFLKSPRAYQPVSSVEAVYGLPLSDKKDLESSLEWRFLEWLAKGK